MRTLQEVLDALAVPGTDHDAVVDYLSGSLRVRRRHRKVLTAAAVGVLLVAGVAFAVVDSAPEDEIVADRKASEPRRSTTTTAAGQGAAAEATTTTLVATTSSLPFVSTTSVPPSYRSSSPTAPFVVPLPSSTTTTMADRPLSATLEAVTASPTVGEVVAFKVVWSDPDLPADVQPTVSLQSGDPAVSGEAVGAESAVCAAGGQPRSGTLDAATRYSRSGSYTVSAVVSACGRSLVVSTDVTVGAPANRRAVVVTTSDPVLHPEAANVAFSTDPADPAGWLPFPPRDPSLRLYHDGSPATVVVLDASATGTVRLQFGSSSLCGPVDLPAVPPEVTARVSVSTAC